MKRLILAILGLTIMQGFSHAGDHVKVFFGFNFGVPTCVEERVVYVDRSPEVIVVKPRPMYYYQPYERVIIVEKHKHKHWKHHHWDWD